jgi:SAM-dependent methyltransferase
VGPHVPRYQLDLHSLDWHDVWDTAFLLDVLEHLEDDAAVMGQVARALRPGGYAMVTAPALDFFWSSNDELVHHLRRYCRADLQKLADATGLELVDARYFMFLLSPLLFLRRRRGRPAERLSDTEKQRWLEREHRIPPQWLNAILGAIFAAETPLGLYVSFPWGTSILGVFRKPPGR